MLKYPADFVFALVLAGPIPPSLGGLTALVELNLSGNQLSGESIVSPDEI